jgi:hypothetical protein
LQSVADAVTNQCILKGKDCFTLPLFKYMALPTTAPAGDKAAIWQRLSDSGLMAFAPSMIAGMRGKDALRPIIHVTTKLSDVVATQCTDIIPSFQESYNISALNVFLTASPHRLTNSAILQSFFDGYLSSATSNRKRGKIANAQCAYQKLICVSLYLL